MCGLKSAFLATILFCVTSSLAAASGPTFITLYKFQGSTDGWSPVTTVAAHDGVLFGTTQAGGDLSCGYYGCGTVFELIPPATKGDPWTETVLYSFKSGSDGRSPWGFIFDKKGNLYGTTYVGGTAAGCGCGTVYRLSPPASPGGNWTETVLYQFQGGTDGSYPEGGLAIDEAGNLYGTTTQGGQTSCTPYDCGTVFELSPPSSGQGPWTETILYRFQGVSDGAFPQGNLLVGPGGVVYGTAGAGTDSLGGVVFQLTPPASGGSWTFNVIYDFSQPNDGRFPDDLTVYQGALYGINSSSHTGLGGDVFQLTPSHNGTWAETVLYEFSYEQYVDGWSPTGAVVFDKSGNLYGVTTSGGTGTCNFGCGTVYELTPAQSGPWTETVLHNFEGNDGYIPQGVSFVGAALYGMTYQGGKLCPGNEQYGCGTVFKVIP